MCAKVHQVLVMYHADIHQSLVLNEDYSVEDPLRVTFMPGDAVACADITIIQDSLLEGTHSFSVEVSDVVKQSGSSDPLLTTGTSAVISILDDEGTFCAECTHTAIDFINLYILQMLLFSCKQPSIMSMREMAL